MRHAIYFTPNPSSELHRLGSDWLGRDVFSGERRHQPDDRLLGLTASARRYGLHGTLKPPFMLKQNVQQAAFDAAVSRLASQHESFLAPPLKLELVDDFLALVPSMSCPALDDLAADCVQRLDDFRSPAGEAELRRRRSVGLSGNQEQNLLRWGYPYVLDEFQFHITLTERLSSEDLNWVRPIAERHFAPILGKGLMIDAITLMLEPDAGDDFRAVERFPLVYNALKAA